MYRTTERSSSEAVALRVLLRARYVAPLAALALAAALLFASGLARARASLVVMPYASPRFEPEQRDVLVAPARITVAAYTWRSGTFLFGDESNGELDAWYDGARVIGTSIVLSEPRPRADGEDALHFRVTYALHGPEAPPHDLTIGFMQDERVEGVAARSIEAWMRGPHDQPLRVAWWTRPASATFVFGAIAAASLVAIALLSRTRIRATLDGDVVRIEARHALVARTSLFPRNEIRTITVQSRVLGLSFARPLVVTTQGRKIPIGPQLLPDDAAAELASRIRALVS